MSGSVQELMAQAREMLASRGAPVTTDNLNRAMLMLSGTGDTRTEQAAEGFDMNAQVDRMINRSTPRRANVPRNTQPNAPVGTTEAAPTETPAVTAPVEAPVEAAPSANQRRVFIPGEETMYTSEPESRSSLDGSGMQNRLLRDLLMGAESASVVGGALPLGLGRGAAASPNVVSVGSTITPPRAAPMANAVDLTQALPGVARPAAQTRTVPIRQAVDDMVGTPPPAPLATAATATPRGVTPPLTPQQIAELSARNPRVAAGFAEARRIPGASAELGPMQRATLLGPGEAGNAAATAARAGAKPRNMSQAQRQRRQNIAESQ